MNALWAVSVVNTMLYYKLKKKTENYDQYNSRAGNSVTDHLVTCLPLIRAELS